MIIGITGSIGSGKTTVAKLFSKHWFNRIDADAIGHHLMRKNFSIYKKLKNFFGDGILDKNRNIDRTRLGDIVFSNKKKLKKLNSMIHPIIIKKIQDEIKKIQKKCGYKTKIVVEAPLLFETKSRNIVDKILVVKCNKKNILKRLNKKYPKEKIENILKAQIPLQEKLEYADFVVDNNKDLIHLENQVKNIIRKIFHSKHERFLNSNTSNLILRKNFHA